MRVRLAAGAVVVATVLAGCHGEEVDQESISSSSSVPASHSTQVAPGETATIPVDSLIGQTLESAYRAIGYDGSVRPEKGAPGLYLYDVTPAFSDGKATTDRGFDTDTRNWIVIGACGRTGNDLNLGLSDAEYVTPEVRARASRNEYAGKIFECTNPSQPEITVLRRPG